MAVNSTCIILYCTHKYITQGDSNVLDIDLATNLDGNGMRSPPIPGRTTAVPITTVVPIPAMCERTGKKSHRRGKDLRHRTQPRQTRTGAEEESQQQVA